MISPGPQEDQGELFPDRPDLSALTKPLEELERVYQRVKMAAWLSPADCLRIRGELALLERLLDQLELRQHHRSSSHPIPLASLLPTSTSPIGPLPRPWYERAVARVAPAKDPAWAKRSRRSSTRAAPIARPESPSPS